MSNNAPDYGDNLFFEPKKHKNLGDDCKDVKLAELIQQVEILSKENKKLLNLRDKIKVNGNYPDKISNLKSKIKHLLDLKANQDKEVEYLRDLLKECKNIVVHDLWAKPEFPDGQVVDKEDLLTRINAAIGEGENDDNRNR